MGVIIVVISAIRSDRARGD